MSTQDVPRLSQMLDPQKSQDKMFSRLFTLMYFFCFSSWDMLVGFRWWWIDPSTGSHQPTHPHQATHHPPTHHQPTHHQPTRINTPTSVCCINSPAYSELKPSTRSCEPINAHVMSWPLGPMRKTNLILRWQECIPASVFLWGLGYCHY